jgi:hypothetical protein
MSGPHARLQESKDEASIPQRRAEERKPRLLKITTGGPKTKREETRIYPTVFFFFYLFICNTGV